MFTGASNADLAIILVDARNGITDQTKRHSILSAILGIPHVLVCINKMDLVDYAESHFEKIKSDYQQFAKSLKLKEISFLPVSALVGDNVVHASSHMPWYKGVSLLQFIEEVDVDVNTEKNISRFQVQLVIRPQSENLHDYRGYAGQVLSGRYKKGDQVMVLPSGIATHIERIEKNQKEVEFAIQSEPVVLHLKDDIDISRGSTIVPAHQMPKTENELEATICWMDNTAYQPGQKFLLQQNSFRTKAVIKEIIAGIDIHSFASQQSDGNMKLNDICKVQIKTAEKLSYDAYAENRSTGAFILINENTNNTVAAGTIG
jgi:sulfate adenylyltransferase subunit 1